MFTIRNFESRTLNWWYDQREKIDFSPSYQRKGRLWSTKDKSYLIDSILNGFDMPKIYLADFTFFKSELNEHKKPYAVIDGKQRFEAMFDFYQGKLVLDKEFVYLDNPELAMNGLSFKDIKSRYPNIASIFENFNVSVISIITDSEALINEMFIRLNNSKPLTGAELRNAMKGDIPKYTRLIIEHHFFTSKIRFNIQRGQDANVAAKLLLIEFRGKFVDTKKANLDRLVNDVIAAESTSLENAYRNIKDILSLMDSTFIDNDPLLGSSGLIPIYFFFFRTYGDSNSHLMRNFLVDFERRRKANKTAPKKNGDFLAFDNFARSINDQASLQGGFNILGRKWKDWEAVNEHNF